jgi:hypothetical protein
MITLHDETLEQLKTLMNRFDEEWAKDWKEQNADQLHVDTYAIIDMVRNIIKPKIPVINIKVPLYQEDDYGNIVPFNKKEVDEALSSIQNIQDIDGYVYQVVDVTYETLD